MGGFTTSRQGDGRADGAPPRSSKLESSGYREGIVGLILSTKNCDGSGQWGLYPQRDSEDVASRKIKASGGRVGRWEVVITREGKSSAPRPEKGTQGRGACDIICAWCKDKVQTALI